MFNLLRLGRRRSGVRHGTASAAVGGDFLRLLHIELLGLLRFLAVEFGLALGIDRALAALNFWHYVHNVVQFPLWLSLITILFPAAMFALAVFIYRGLLRRGNPWLAILAFPLNIVAAE